MASYVTYEKVPRSEADAEQNVAMPARPRDRSSSKVLLTLLLLIATNAATWITARNYPTRSSVAEADPWTKTSYAGLEMDTESVFGGHDQYTDRNETFRDELWKSINIDDGMVALPDEYIREKGLPVSQRFPWDENKGIYLLHGYHNLHCTRNIYIALMEYRNGLPQSRNWRHVIHCLDALRRDVICNADDTPRWTTDSSIPETGHNQPRQCRSWAKLEAWAKQYNACYRYINETNTPDEFPQIQRFIWCKKDSPYRAQVEEHFTIDGWDQ